MTDSIYKKLIQIQKEMEVPKGHYNQFGGFYYRKLEDILEAAKPVLERHGLTMFFNDSIEQVGERYYLKSTVTIANETASVSASAYAREPLSLKGMNDSQITGAASSYSRKYAVGGLILLDDNRDADQANKGEESHSHKSKDKESKLPLALEKINNSKTLDELKNVFISMPMEIKTVDAVIYAKDRKKQELQNSLNDAQSKSQDNKK